MVTSDSIFLWAAGDDLGECADAGELQELGDEVGCPQHPVDVWVAAWEVVFEPDVEDGDPTGALKYAVRVAGDIALLRASLDTSAAVVARRTTIAVTFAFRNGLPAWLRTVDFANRSR